MALTGSPPADNYLDLLQLENSSLGLPAVTLQAVYDGAGNASLLALSQQEVAVLGVFSSTVGTGLLMDTGVPITGDELISDKITYKTNTDVGIFFGSGDPEGAVVASPGSLMLRDDGTVGSSLYIKEAGTSDTGWTPVDLVSSFLDLSDTPGAFVASRWVKVNAAANALEFVAFSPIASPAGAAQGEVLYYNGSSWVNLGVGTDGHVLTTHGAGADPTWEEASGGSGASSWLDLIDTDPSTYLGQGGKYVRVNSTPDGLEFATPDWITDPGSPAQGQVLYYNGTAWAVLAPGTNGQVLTTGGAGANPSWEDSSGSGASTFLDLTDTPEEYSGDQFVKVNAAADALEFVYATYIEEPEDGVDTGDILYFDSENWVNFPRGTEGQVLKSTSSSIEWGDAASGGEGKAYVTTEYDTGDTWRGKPIYAIVVDFGAGPNNTTKSVASGLGVNDVFHVVDMQVMANDAQYGWIAQEDSANKASFTYNKLDYKVYCTTSNDLSGVEYQVLLKYIKEPASMSGTDPHVIATVSGGTWAGLAPGVHLLTPDTWFYTLSPSTGYPTTVQCTWLWSTAGTGAEIYKISLKGALNYANSRKSTGLMFSYDGASTVTDKTSFATTSAPASPYSQQLAIGDRLFTSYTIGSVTVTLGRASDFIANPPPTT